MKHKPKDIQYCERLFQSFYEIGSTPQGGVTRLGYTETEDAMHEVFKGLAGNSADRSIRMRSEILMWPIRMRWGIR